MKIQEGILVLNLKKLLILLLKIKIDLLLVKILKTFQVIKQIKW